MTIQLFFNGLITFSIYIILAIGFDIIYRVNKFFHFAHAVVFTSGAYFTFLFIQILGWSYYTAIPAAILVACLIGCMTEWFIYKPLRQRKSSAIVLLLASLGIYIVLQNLISLFFGDDTKSIRTR
ncbi:MAG: hypothetical protein A2315_04995 [Ignavibacteria bacterium RIFOXYB2_FULL_35_12]|nr:MAG: hypothetical protein A2058_12490 [Ignavibacteria bacterium GWA2_36_19]OGU60783.1 MAG: hypothetical protein A2X60_09610 [Ignavibacteria bacterium GWF2_35_20]OGU83090.1 MAG: hypothetical protein A2254_08580 [Ignavibacteria bacterium RIFOXYA2_FULL_35_9]OGU84177.1 MAG: hypothetical protein A3K31_03240 [Ignavibacteria bacterium RIFOXYA12_FULL_35_25]OGU97327.1 MAG: hypothetical protein A2347_06655 [Ignavibacteria bacterium RIFOXYB12_FULL_35_14]OGU99500.1 MAG: hypothetical protein A2455_05725